MQRLHGRKNPVIRGQSAREIALSLLLERELYGGDVTELFRLSIDGAAAALSAQERAFFRRLAVGTVERQISLDAVIDRIASVKTKAMKALIRCDVRMGAYQILYLDAVPDRAAVDEAVRLVKKQVPPQLSGFVNAVLRRISRERDKILAWLSLPGTPRTVRYAMPPYLCRLFEKERGEEETERIFAAFLERRRLCLRPDPRLLSDAEGYAAWERALAGAVGEIAHHPVLPALLLIDDPGDIRRLPGYAGGAFAVQDAASALAVAAAGLRASDLVLDVCAAPGGKTMYAAALLKDPAQMTARDISEEKCALIRENAERMRLSGMRIEAHDAAEYDASLADRFDAVFCDLPCTGFGVIGRKPEIKYHAAGSRTDALAALQRRILDVAWRYVKPGGKLIYSTCTISRAENEENVRWFLETHPDFSTEPWLDAAVPGSVRGSVRDGCLLLLPGDRETDGFYIARMRRTER